MYADDTVIYTLRQMIQANELTQSVANESDWLKLKVNKTVGMFFSKSKLPNYEAEIYLAGEKNTSWEQI